MDHVAILKKANIRTGDNLLQDIKNGSKTIESRWYVNKFAPWSNIKANDTVYFKEAGKPITAKAVVSKVIQYSLKRDSDNILFSESQYCSPKDIVKKYGKDIAPSTTITEWEEWLKNQENKRFCILVFLSDVKAIKHFEINKAGFGSGCAWLCVDSIDNIKI